MDILSFITGVLADDRFAANLIAFYSMVVATVIGSLVLRRVLVRSGGALMQSTHMDWLNAVGEEAGRRLRSLLFWVTFLAVFGIAAAGVAYHLGGRDVRQDLGRWYERLTAEEVVRFAGSLGLLAALLVGTRFLVWAIRRGLPLAESSLMSLIEPGGNRQTWQRWFLLLERYLVTATRLLALWAAARVVGLDAMATVVLGFLLRVLSILAVARLLTLAWRGLARMLAEAGDHHLGQGAFKHYWERITRLLFPFGERCFEAAVYVSAASLCVRELQFIAFVADFGPRIVQCIGILFSTRVLIELSQVLLNEAFGMYAVSQTDQKGRTLVPLLQSVCQYVLYLGSAIVMLGVLGVDTRPILAGAGILGLAVGLGAQNLVTDLVSGFFILFENQYLVGDYVQIGDACGTVEAVGIRLTQIRDGQGKLHIIPNGQIKGVVSCSKGYINAVVDVQVPEGTNLEGVFRAMALAGQRLRASRAEVLADTEILGLVSWDTSHMTVRAVTKVQPGMHAIMESEYRRFLRQVFDEEAAASRAAPRAA